MSPSRRRRVPVRDDREPAGHVLSLAGNLTNNGTLDFSTSGNLAGAGITFTGATSNTFSGTGGTTDIRALTVNKGASAANVLDLSPSSFSVQGTTTDGTPSAWLTLTNGTLKISGTFSGTHRRSARPRTRSARRPGSGSTTRTTPWPARRARPSTTVCCGSRRAR
jgi:hypothetical protein